jgi:hypothetical protein
MTVNPATAAAEDFMKPRRVISLTGISSFVGCGQS